MQWSGFCHSMWSLPSPSVAQRSDARLRLKRKKARNSLLNCEPCFKVGATRFERATSCSQSRRSSQAELRPDSHRQGVYTCHQVCWERRLSDFFENRRRSRVTNNSKSRKVHSAVFFCGRQDPRKYLWLINLPSSEMGFLAQKSKFLECSALDSSERAHPRLGKPCCHNASAGLWSDGGARQNS